MLYKKITFCFAIMLTFSFSYAGNEDRAGSAGATELLINPWAKSSSWGSAGISSVNGLEAIFLNVAGLAYAEQTEIQFSRTNWLGSITGIGLNAAGLAQKVGESGVFGISFVGMNYGDLQITTTELPDNPAINWEVGKKVNSELSIDNDIKVEWIITKDTQPGHYTSILTSTNGRDIKSETYTDTDLPKLEKTLREQALQDFNQLKLERG